MLVDYCTDSDSDIETIYATERKIKQDVQYQIEDILTPIGAKHTPSDHLPGSDDVFLSYCDCISAGSLTNALCKQKLWPLSIAVRQLSIAMFCRKLEACDFGLPHRITNPKKCTKCPGDIVTQIIEIRKRALLTKFEGLCLDCIQSPGKSEEERKSCRVPHKHFRGLPRQLWPSNP
jgi:hypothetical protein